MSDAIDKTKSVAYLSNFAGIKSYPDGGIEINKNLVSDDKYEKIRDDLIKLLSELEGLDNEPLLSWVARREEVYPGKFTERIYPDILLNLGLDMALDGILIPICLGYQVTIMLRLVDTEKMLFS